MKRRMTLIHALILLTGSSLALNCSLCFAEKIYNPITKEAVYEYKGDFEEFKANDFECLSFNGVIDRPCFPFNLNRPIDFQNGVPLDGFEFYAWERGWNIPKKPYSIYTFLTKEGENFVWKPYSIDEIENIMGD